MNKLNSVNNIIPKLINKEANQKLEIMCLGGLGEIGKNTWVVKCKEQILLIDAGLGFPNESMPGVDIVFPDLSYLQENREKILGLVITHGHEDHIGGVVNMIKNIDVPIIYGAPLSIGLIELKLKEHGLLQKATIKRIKARETVQLGDFAVTFCRNNHSIPDSFGLIIQTPIGTIAHSGDFKFDNTPVDNELFDIAAFAEAGKQGIELLVSDSTNAEKEGYTASERYVYSNIEKVFVHAKKRIFITTFASQVHRIKQILELAQAYGKKIAILGRSMLNIALISRQLGYMTFPDGLIIRAEEVSNHPLNKIVILTTGSQGEPLSALTRIANGSHKQISILPGDTVIISATPIPGNERSVASVINALFSKGANVVYGKESGVHVSGHASKEDQKILLNLTKPKFFMPAHGEYKMLVEHGETAKKILKINDNNVFIMNNGDVLELSTDKDKNTSARINGKINVGVIMIDSNNHSFGIREEVVLDRHKMSKQGIISLVMSIDEKEILCGPELILKGVIFSNNDQQKCLEELTMSVREVIFEKWKNIKNKTINEIEEDLKNILKDCCSNELKKIPVQIMILKAENNK